jgi:hypothetical protein
MEVKQFVCEKDSVDKLWLPRRACLSFCSGGSGGSGALAIPGVSHALCAAMRRLFLWQRKEVVLC